MVETVAAHPHEPTDVRPALANHTSHPPARELYGYQREGVKFLIRDGGGAIWDEPGLGKTAQAIVAAHVLAPNGPILIICPNSLKHWWRAEISALYPAEWRNILTATVGGRIEQIKQGARYDTSIHYVYEALNPKWVICHYAGVRISQESYAQIPWAAVILDEAHYIKNRKAARTKACLKVTPALACRLCLTATPFSNNPADLWSQIHWLAPTVPNLTNYWKWFNYFVNYTWEQIPGGRRYRKIHGGKNLDWLAEIMAAYGIQRTKAEVAPQLPPLTETRMPIAVSGRQRKIYEVLRTKARVEIAIRHTEPATDSGSVATPGSGPLSPSLAADPTCPDCGGHVLARDDYDTLPFYCSKCVAWWNGSEVGAGSGPKPPAITGLIIKNVLSRLIKMEQWLSCPWEFDPGVKGAKLEWLLEWAATNDKPAVIVSRFRATAKYLAQALNKHRGGCASERAIEGGVPLKVRLPIINKWQGAPRDRDPQFLVGTIHTLGTGLNLDRADTLICYDQVYDAILMEQVRQRTHRITTDHPVQVIYLVCEDTSNEVVYEAFLRKWKDMRVVRELLRHLREESS